MENKVKIQGIKKVMAEHMSRSWHTSPILGVAVNVDMQKAMDFKEALNKKYAANTVKVTINHILIKSVSKALQEFPNMNASYDDGMITLHDSINIGLAVDIGEGLIVPNIKNVQNLDYITLVAETSRIINNAKQKKLNMDDITGGTFTITNLGMLGIESCFPIINHPELGILGVNQIINTPVVINNEIVVRPMMKLNLNADHRVIEGAYASRFLITIKALLENPKE